MLYEQALAMYYRGAFAGSKDASKLSEQSREMFKTVRRQPASSCVGRSHTRAPHALQMGIVVPATADQQPPFLDQWRISAYVQKMASK